ncbi:MAG: adenylate/guanylate cyclase domain-containing protein [Candidatus Riflebacteria bacterium]|nr:adenylate/guanylate cyclase domain-containing protein [Candidatus Riflebacteria bacterium]
MKTELGESPGGGGFRRARALFPFVLPVALLVLLLVIIAWSERTQADWNARQRESLLQDDARSRLETFRRSCSYAAQMQILNRALRLRLSRGLLRRLDRTGRADFDLVRTRFLPLFRRIVPAAFRPPGSSFYLFSLGPGGKPRPETGPGLAARKNRFMATLVGQLIRYDRSTTEELAAADKNCQSAFGGGCPVVLVAEIGKGRPVLGRTDGADSFLLWDTIDLRGRPVGAYLMTFPLATVIQSRPLRRALDSAAVAARPRGGLPFLVPMEDGRVGLTPAFPTGRGSPDLRRTLRGVLRAGPRETVVPLSTLVRHDGWYFFRDILRVGSTFEFWMAYPAAGGVGGRHGPGRSLAFQLLAGVTGILTSLLLAHLWIFGAPPFLTLRLWFPGYIGLVGGLPLTVLYLVGSMQIEISRLREIQTLREEAISKLEEIDAGHASMFLNFTGVARRLVTNPAWRQACLSGRPAEIDRAAAACLAAFRAAGLPLRHFLVIPLEGRPRIFSDDTIAARMAGSSKISFFQSVRDSCLEAVGLATAVGTGAGDPTVAGIGRWMATLGAFMNMGDQRKDVLFGTMHQGTVTSSVGSPELHFSDFLGVGGGVKTFVAFLAGSTSGMESRLRYMATRFNASVGPYHCLAVIRRQRGEHWAVAPRLQDKFWRTDFGRMLQRYMGLASRQGSRQVGQRGSHLFVAHPCRSVPEIILGLHVPTSDVEDRAAEGRFRLRCLTVLIVLFVVLVGTSLSRFFVTPLRQVETCLTRVAAGDLGSRVGFTRRDELGKLAASFDEMIDGLRKRQDLGRFVSGTLEARLVESEWDGLVEPLLRNGAILVSDLRGFTTISEQKPPEAVVGMLNQHLEEMVDGIRRQGGLIEKFIGDAIIAAFYDTPARPGLAAGLLAASDMRRRHLERQRQRQAAGEFTYEMGIGLAAGAILSGTVFSAGRLEHVVLGRVRAEAESLETLSKKGAHTRVVLARETAAAARQLFPDLRLAKIGFDEGFELEVLLPGDGKDEA